MRGRVSVWRSTALPCIALLFLTAPIVQAQDVAAAARQEQTRKVAEKTPPKHVYTEDDLKKDKILTREDGAKVAARKRQQEQERTPPEADAKQLPPAEETAETESLGEIARRYRKEKAARDAEEAAKKSYTPFPYEVQQLATAAPKGSVAPADAVPPAEKQPYFADAIRPTMPQRVPQTSTPRLRRSPFQPRPLVAAPPLLLAPAPSAAVAPSAERTTSPVARAAPERRSGAGLRPITVQQGDSWWKLAVLYMGRGSRWVDLRALNSGMAGPSELLRSGATVFVPGGKMVPIDSSDRTKRTKQLRVKAGDTLWTLAREHFGRASAWRCLAKANPQIQDYRRLAIGTLVELPESSVAGSCGMSSEVLRR